MINRKSVKNGTFLVWHQHKNTGAFIMPENDKYERIKMKEQYDFKKNFYKPLEKKQLMV